MRNLYLAASSIKYFETVLPFRLICRLKESIGSNYLSLSGILFRARIIDGRNELKYKAVIGLIGLEIICVSQIVTR